MKILAIRGRNIASLAQEFAIELEAEPLATVSLYAIAGPTGAGKSSLLDTLCLALYDQTPRLRAASTQGSKLPEQGEQGLGATDTRQLLRRGATEGHAEVDFTGTDGHHWRARWSVRRAHLRREGRLQAVEMSLLQLPQLNPAADSGNKTETLAAIRRRIGLDYLQFTHSVLLAQNEFAAFLRADQDERARLLQALTGSERFERLSIAAFERSRAERDELTRRQARLDSTAPLPAEQRQELEAALNQAEERLRSRQVEHQRLQSWLAWRQDEARLSAVLQQARQAAEQARQQLEADGPKRSRLEGLLALQDIRNLWQRCEETRGDLAALEQEHDLTTAAEAELARAQAEANSELERSKLALQGQRAEAAKLEPALSQARELDRQLLDQRAALSEASGEHQAVAAEAAQIEQELSATQTAAAKLAEQLRQTVEALESRQPERVLLQDPRRWQRELDELQHLRSEEEQLAQQATALRQRQTELQQQQQAAAAELAQQERLQQASAAALASLEAELERLRAADLPARRRNWQQTRDQLLEHERQWRGMQELSAQIDRAENQLSECRARIAQTQASIPPAQTRRAEAEAAREQASTALLAARSATSGSELRATLADEQPCPVCGSREHPWADPQTLLRELGGEADDDATSALRQLLNELETQSTQAQTRADQANQALTLLQARREQDQRALDEIAQAQALRHAELDAWRQRLAADPVTEAWLQLDQSAQEAALIQAHADLDRAESALGEQEAALQRTERDRAQAREAWAQAEAARTAAQRQVDQLRERRHADELALGSAQAQLQGVQTQGQRLATMVTAWLAPMGLTLEQTLSELRAELQQRVEAHNALLQTQQAQLTEQQTLLNRMPLLQQQQHQHGRQLAQLLQRVDTLQQAAALCSEQRAQLLDGASVAEVESRLREDLRQSEARYEASRADAEQAQLQLVEASGRRTELERQARQAHARLDQLLRQRQQRWRAGAATQWANSAGLALPLAEALIEPAAADEAPSLAQARADLVDALAVEPDAIAQIQAALRESELRLLEANAHIEAQQASHAEHQRRRPSGEMPVDAATALDVSGKELDGAVRELQQLQVRLQEDDRLQHSASELSLELEQQRQVFANWNRLSALIGSADGKKFRNLAQRHSLRLLLCHGNAQLRQLGSRYSLRPVDDELNFLLVDHELGDELRLVHSLSGGESFLVSLALALALASLSSEDLPIESLLIDEGFGSLDEETLNIAMLALDRLQAQGRKVGVISHLRELTDRIGVKIEVLPMGMGRSRVVVGGDR